MSELLPQIQGNVVIILPKRTIRSPPPPPYLIVTGIPITTAVKDIPKFVKGFRWYRIANLVRAEAIYEIRDIDKLKTIITQRKVLRPSEIVRVQETLTRIIANRIIQQLQETSTTSDTYSYTIFNRIIQQYTENIPISMDISYVIKQLVVKQLQDASTTSDVLNYIIRQRVIVNPVEIVNDIDVLNVHIAHLLIKNFPNAVYVSDSVYPFIANRVIVIFRDKIPVSDGDVGYLPGPPEYPNTRLWYFRLKSVVLVTDSYIAQKGKLRQGIDTTHVNDALTYMIKGRIVKSYTETTTTKDYLLLRGLRRLSTSYSNAISIYQYYILQSRIKSVLSTSYSNSISIYQYNPIFTRSKFSLSTSKLSGQITIG